MCNKVIAPFVVLLISNLLKRIEKYYIYMEYVLQKKKVMELFLNIETIFAKANTFSTCFE